MASACPLPTAMTLTRYPVRRSKMGSSESSSPASRVEVVVARMMSFDCVMEDGGGWWRVVEESHTVASSGRHLHQPPPTSTILHALVLTSAPASARVHGCCCRPHLPPRRSHSSLA